MCLFSLVQVHYHRFVAICFQPLEPIGFFSSVRVYLAHRPICSCLCTSTLVYAHPLSYLCPFVVAGTCLCSFVLTGTHLLSFVLVCACWDPFALVLCSFVLAGTHLCLSMLAGTHFHLIPGGLPLQFPSCGTSTAPVMFSHASVAVLMHFSRCRAAAFCRCA